MQIYSVNDARQGLDFLTLDIGMDSPGSLEVPTYRIPLDSGAKVALARRIAGALLNCGSALLWITGWGIWPSSEHLDLFDRYRLSFGETRSLGEAPIHLLEKSEEEILVSLISIGLFFIWDMELFDLERKLVVRVSHDGWIESKMSSGEEELCVSLRDDLMLEPWT